MTSPRSIPCPRCSAPSGAPCVDRWGYTHIERAEAFTKRYPVSVIISGPSIQPMSAIQPSMSPGCRSKA